MAGEFARPLRLTSPLTRGDRVRDAQWLLSGHNRFEGLATLKDGALDGFYGPMSADATRRAKFWLGYPAGGINRVFGQTLYEYLRKERWRPLPADYQVRRRQRLQAAQKTAGEKALEEAVTHLGYEESPFGSNHTMFGVAYGLDREPWCAIFESYCFGHSGYVRADGRWRFRYSYVPTIYEDARAGRNGLRQVWTPRPGDLALFDLHGERLAHTAFVREPPVEGYFVDLGGNTGPVNVSNGGAVASQRRSTALVHAYVRVG